MCLVRWAGKVANKAGTRRFHKFDVLVKSDDTITSNPTVSTTTATSTAAEEVADEDDELPF
jgi:hypothetical protein